MREPRRRSRSVILSGVATSLREVAAQSKDPYPLNETFLQFVQNESFRMRSQAAGLRIRCKRSFDFMSPFASERTHSAQDDSFGSG